MPAAKKPAAKKPAAKKQPVESPKLYACTIATIVHPFQKVRFNPGSPMPCQMDNWLESQIKAGLIKSV